MAKIEEGPIPEIFGRRKFLERAGKNTLKTAVVGGALITGALSVRHLQEAGQGSHNSLNGDLGRVNPNSPDSSELPFQPGENLIENSDFHRYAVAVDPETNKPYRKPDNWIASNSDHCQYLPGFGPNGSACLEVNATEKSSWQSQKPFEIEPGPYVLTFEVWINRKNNQDVSGVRPKISVIAVGPDGSKQTTLFYDWPPEDNIMINAWTPVRGEIRFPVDEPQEAIVELTGFDLISDEVREPKTVRFANVTLQRMIGPGEPDYPGILTNPNYGSA